MLKSAKWYKKRLDDVRKTINLGGFENVKKINEDSVLLFIGVAQIEGTKDLLELAKLVVSFAFGMWVSKWI